MGNIILVAVALLIGWFAVDWGWPMWLAAVVGGAAGVLARFVFLLLLGTYLAGYANRLSQDESSDDTKK